MPTFRKTDAAVERTSWHQPKYSDDGTINPLWTPRASGKRHMKSTHGFFVAWDGEEMNTGRSLALPNGLHDTRTKSVADRPEYRSVDEHILTLMACSDGKTAYHLEHDNKERLTSLELLEFIGECYQKYGELAVHVSFFFTYDASHILRDIPRDEVRKAYAAEKTKLGNCCRYGPYLIKYLPRKKLWILKLRDIERPYKISPKGKRSYDKEWSVTIWDAHGFVQGSFEKAIKEWSLGNEEQRTIIKRGKHQRDQFATWSNEDIRIYNDAENALLVEMMNKLRAALRASDLHLARWDGAGAIAAAMFKKELPKDYIKSIVIPTEIDEAGHYAFAGGQIECVQHGTYNGIVNRSDINSAYPAAMALIPDLQSGEWRQWDGSPVYQDYALYRVEWKHAVAEQDQLPFYPFFYRDMRDYIFFPSFGENWIWGVELNAAIASGIPLAITVHEGYEFIPANDTKPFAFIKRYYQRRAEIKQRIKQGIADSGDAGISLAIKLGLNSMYGKTAQKVGYDADSDTRPAFYNVLIAGWCTAYTRAKMFRAAYPIRDSVIAFATDGLLSTEPIANVVDSKELGEWETDTLSGLQIVQSGVYWTCDARGEWSEKSRGFDRNDNANERRLRVSEMWKAGDKVLPFRLRRFVASKYASLTEARWAIHCAWLTEERTLKLYDAGEKRQPITYGKKALHRKLYHTLPSYSPQSSYGDIGMSRVCRTLWRVENLSALYQAEDDETLIDEE
jgi:DNA polymerase type B, organellar and viral